MALMAGNIIQTQIRGRCFGQRIILVENFVVSLDFPGGTSIFTDLKGIAADFLAGGARNALTPYLACLPPQYQAEEVRAQRIWPERSAFQIQTLTDLVGTNAGAATVANDAAAVTMRTELAGRRFVSTRKIGPAPDSVSAAGLLLDDYKTLLATWGNKMASAWVPTDSASSLDPVIWHRDLFTFTNIKGFSIGPQSRVQRRRTVGIGE